MDFKKIVSYLKPTTKAEIIPASAPTMLQRSFRAALNNRFVDWLFTSRNKINVDLVNQLKTLITRSRDLAVNNELFRSFLSNQQKTIVGSQGFRLQMQIKNADGTLNEPLNEQIEWAWYDFTRKQNLEVSEHYNDVDFDLLILRTLMIDGQCFIRIIKDSKSPYGVKFKLIDSLSVDCDKLQIMTETQNGIYNGIQIDHNYKVVRYWLREGYNGNYESGKLYTVPADQIIHLYRSEFIDQIRGFSQIVASLQSLKQLDDYAIAELIAAKVSSCQGVFYERNSDAPNGDFLNQQQMIDEGSFLTELNPGVASIVPRGYTIKTLTPNHPSSDYNGFTKSIAKRVASSMGTGYNILNHDYSDVNYSSLKQANIDDNNTIKLWQRFLIENWKNVEFELFLKGYLINSKTSLKPSDYRKYLRSYRFIGRVNPHSDPAKQIVAIERRLKLGLTSPIKEIQKSGDDVNQVAKDWAKWFDICKKWNLPFTYSDTQNEQSQSFEDSNINKDEDAPESF